MHNNQIRRDTVCFFLLFLKKQFFIKKRLLCVRSFIVSKRNSSFELTHYSALLSDERYGHIFKAYQLFAQKTFRNSDAAALKHNTAFAVTTV